MTTSVSIEKPVTRKLKGILSGDKQALESSLFAINWFDTRSALLYNIYNYLAAPRLFRIGGKILLKGKVIKQLAGDPALGRQYLLIVNYPSGHQFLELMSDRFFLLVGLLRMISVKRFSFVLHRRIGDQQLSSEPDRSIAFLHVTDQSDNEKTRSEIRTLVDGSSVSVSFESEIAARLSTQKEGGEPQPAPYITDNVFVLEADSEQELEALFESAELTRILPDPSTYYAANLNRLL